MKTYLFCFFSLICFLSCTIDRCFAQEEGGLYFNVPTTAFFKNNEYTRKIALGYTLGGFRITPNVEYRADSSLSLFLGANLLRYWGADNYGSYNYINIPYYTDTNTQHQIHIRPYFLIRWKITPHQTLFVGDIYRYNSHFLPQPLYNTELHYTQDAEEGMQIISNYKYWTNDLWLWWQNFNFFNDVDRERFLFGTSGNFHIGNVSMDISKGMNAMILNYALLWRHIGGELDTNTILPICHWVNMRLGISYVRHLKNDAQMAFNFDYLVSKDVRGGMWYFKDGRAFFPNIRYENRNFDISLGYFDSKKFISMYGNAFFNNYAQRCNTISYPHNKMMVANLAYKYSFAKEKYCFSIFSEFYYKIDKNTNISTENRTLSFALGLKFYANITAFLKKIKL